MIRPVSLSFRMVGIYASTVCALLLVTKAQAADIVLVFAGQSNMVGMGTVNTTLQPGDAGLIPGVMGFYSSAPDSGNGPERQAESVYNAKGFQYDWATRIGPKGVAAGGSWQPYEAWKQSWTVNGTSYAKSPSSNTRLGDFWALGLNPGGPFENGAMAFKNQIRVQAYGPELRVARRIHEARPDDTIYIIKYAVGGTGISKWTPANTDCYAALQAWVGCARAALPRPAPISGFFWMQGESDALSANEAAQYRQRLDAMIAQVRADAGAPRLPVVLAKIHPGLAGEANYAVAWGKWGASKGSAATVEMVRAAQAAIAATTPGVRAVETSDLTLMQQEWLDNRNDKMAVLKDTVAIHLDQASILAIGDRMAAAWLEMNPAK